MSFKFRDLTADEIECRVQSLIITDKTKGAILLLYKNARADMTILDETVGALNWQRRHARENANCIVSVWDEDKGQWVEKEDTGTESFSDAEKGIASDSFKRACTNWGIGRELYTAPFIWVPLVAKDGAENFDVFERNGKFQTKTEFVVTFVKIKNKKIVGINIENPKKKRTVFAWGDLTPDEEM